MNNLEDKYQQFLSDGKARSDTFHLNDIGLSLNYVKSEKIPDWQLHLACCADIISYAFAYDHQNYARWGPIYLAEMLLLPETAPEVQALFDSGEHVVRRSSSGSFNSVWTDLGLEQSAVKDSKSRKGGIIGICRQESATLKWYLAVHVRSVITRNFKSFCQLNDVEEPIHRSLTKSMIMKDEQDIQSITSVATDRFGNPFTIASDVEELEKPAPLINMATGVVAPDEVTKELLTGKELGRMALKDYVEHCLQDQDISMIKPIKRLNLKTFATIERFSAKGKNKPKPFSNQTGNYLDGS